MRLSAAAVVILVAGAMPAEAQPGRCRASLADYRTIAEGDSLKAVVARFGCRGRKVGDVTYGGRRRVNYSWSGQGDFGANVTLTFVNGKLAHKSELGLE